MKKVALLTGGTSKLGPHIAKLLCRKGFYVVIQYNNPSSKIQADQLIKEGSINAAIQADFTHNNDIINLVNQALSIENKIDLLINNASIFELDNNFNFTAETLQKHISINAIAPIVLIKEIFSRQQKALDIINLLDKMILNQTKTYFSYNLSKRLLESASGLLASSYEQCNFKSLYLDKINTPEELQKLIDEIQSIVKN